MKMIVGIVCNECGITEDKPVFMQKYCRYCGGIFNTNQLDYLTNEQNFLQEESFKNGKLEVIENENNN